MVDLLLYLTDNAFSGVITSPTDGAHSVMTNLVSVGADDWHAVTQTGGRSIADIVEHLSFAKRTYTRQGFARADDPLAGLPRDPQSNSAVGMDVAIDELKRTHDDWRKNVATLSDDDLTIGRRTHWGEPKTMRWFITTMIEHDLYHAGEINHLRSLLDGTDRWGLLPGLREP